MRTLLLGCLVLLGGCSERSSPSEPTRAAPGNVRSAPRAADTSVERPPAPVPIPTRGTFLVVYAEALGDAADTWAAYRAADGWRVDRLSVSTGEAVGSDAPERLREKIVERYGSRRDDPFVVLLLGDAGDAGLPTWSYRQRDPLLVDRRDEQYVGDHSYQRMDDDDLPDIALGRVPARSVDEALALLAKITAYEESPPPGVWKRRVHVTAGEGHYGAMDLVLETMFQGMIDRLLPDANDVSLIYAKPTSPYCPPPEQLTAAVLEQIGGGCLLFNYVGHGWQLGFDRLTHGEDQWSILDVDDLPRAPAAAGRLPIALLTCCSAGWFDLPNGRPSIGEALLFHPDGPIAVIAGSRPTHPYANTILQKDVVEQLLAVRTPTVGALDLAASRSMLEIDDADRQIDMLAMPLALTGGWRTSLGDLRRMHVRLYNLLGDPATRIPHPTPIADLELLGGTLIGSLPGVLHGAASVTIETTHGTIIDPDAIDAVVGRDDPAFAEKAARNFPRANERVLRSIEMPVHDEWLSVEIGDVPANAAVIKVYVQGADAEGRSIDAYGAVSVRPSS